MGMTARLWSINALATELGRDRRTIAKALRQVAPDGKADGGKAWFMTTALAALAAADQPRKPDDLDPAQERARKDRALAEQTEMRNDLTRGSVVLIEDVQRLVVGEYGIVRSRVLSMPSRIASRVPEPVRAVVMAAAQEEARAALDALSANASAGPTAAGTDA
jgi:phage terminase Nu1 subunit (DNA packaging protein)